MFTPDLQAEFLSHEELNSNFDPQEEETQEPIQWKLELEKVVKAIDPKNYKAKQLVWNLYPLILQSETAKFIEGLNALDEKLPF